MSDERPLPQVREVYKDRQEAWRDSAACKGVDPEIFFPERGGSNKGQIALRFCWSCPVTEQCLEFALQAGFKEGIFGGLTVRARQRLKRDRLIWARSA